MRRSFIVSRGRNLTNRFLTRGIGGLLQSLIYRATKPSAIVRTVYLKGRVFSTVNMCTEAGMIHNLRARSIKEK